MKKFVYLLFTLAFLSVSYSKENESTNNDPLIESSDNEHMDKDENETPEDKIEAQRVIITAFVDDKFTLPSGTRCEAEFYDADGTKLDCKKFLSAASEHSFYVGAEL